MWGDSRQCAVGRPVHPFVHPFRSVRPHSVSAVLIRSHGIFGFYAPNNDHWRLPEIDCEPRSTELISPWSQVRIPPPPPEFGFYKPKRKGFRSGKGLGSPSHTSISTSIPPYMGEELCQSRQTLHSSPDCSPSAAVRGRTGCAQKHRISSLCAGCRQFHWGARQIPTRARA